VRQERILLALVEAVDLVDEQRRTATLVRAPLARLLDELAQLLHPSEHGRERDKLRACAARDHARERRLAGSGRPPQDQRRQPIALDELAQRLTARKQRLLPDDLVDAARAHALGERRGVAAERTAAGGVSEQGGLVAPGRAAGARHLRSL
jgi:hypothetical protein